MSTLVKSLKKVIFISEVKVERFQIQIDKSKLTSQEKHACHKSKKSKKCNVTTCMILSLTIVWVSAFVCSC